MINYQSMALATLVILVGLIDVSSSIACYECDSSKDFSCSEFWDPSLDVNYQYYSNCGNVYDAKYCIKMTSIFDGKLGTKRFCSSRDWGDYCEYIQRPGDDREYRSCVFSCSANGCNEAPRSVRVTPVGVLAAMATLATWSLSQVLR